MGAVAILQVSAQQKSNPRSRLSSTFHRYLLSFKRRSGDNIKEMEMKEALDRCGENCTEKLAYVLRLGNHRNTQELFWAD